MLFFTTSRKYSGHTDRSVRLSRARRVIWYGFGALAFASFMASVVVALPPAPFWPHQPAYEVAFGSTWRIVMASMVAYFCGEFVNSFVLAKMKVATQGRWLAARTIGSTFSESGGFGLFYPSPCRQRYPRRQAAASWSPVRYEVWSSLLPPLLQMRCVEDSGRGI